MPLVEAIDDGMSALLRKKSGAQRLRNRAPSRSNVIRVFNVFNPC
jgi:hypothetical protein